jgi:hypothetical protein
VTVKLGVFSNSAERFVVHSLLLRTEKKKKKKESCFCALAIGIKATKPARGGGRGTGGSSWRLAAGRWRSEACGRRLLSIHIKSGEVLKLAYWPALWADRPVCDNRVSQVQSAQNNQPPNLYRTSNID